MVKKFIEDETKKKTGVERASSMGERKGYYEGDLIQCKKPGMLKKNFMKTKMFC